MTKEKFSDILLSRFYSLDEAGRYALISALIFAESELGILCNTERVEDEVEFIEWSQNIKEILFPEVLGEIKLREWDDEA